MDGMKLDDIGRPSPDASSGLDAFSRAVSAEQRASLEAGVPFPVGDGAGGIVWVHPDGTRRAGMEASSGVVD